VCRGTGGVLGGAMTNPLDSAINQHLLNLKAFHGPPGGMGHFTAPGMMMGMMPPPPMFGAPPPGSMMTMPMPMPGQPPGGLPGGLSLGAPHPGGLGLPPTGGQLAVAIDNLPFRYSLSEQDLRDAFGRWGSLSSVQVSRDGAREVGVVTFDDAVDAADAKRQLHGYFCNLDGASGSLAVVHGGPEQLGGRALGLPPLLAAAAGPMPVGQTMPGQLPQSSPSPMSMMPPPPGSSVPSGAVPKSAAPLAPGLAPGGALGALPAVGGPPAAGGAPRPVWCCKIVVQAENLHPEFPTAVKILGAGEANVEHLRGQTNCVVQLRGRGSGLIEGEGRELQEPMFMWLSSENAQSGKAGLEMAQDLLKSVYEEHHSWCTQHNLNAQNISEPIVLENPADVPLPPMPGSAGGPAAGAPPVASGPSPALSGGGPAGGMVPPGMGGPPPMTMPTMGMTGPGMPGMVPPGMGGLGLMATGPTPGTALMPGQQWSPAPTGLGMQGFPGGYGGQTWPMQ